MRKDSILLTGLLPVFVLAFVSHLIPYIYIPSLPQLAKYTDAGQAGATTLMSGYYFSMSISLLLTGIVGDHWDKKLLLHGASGMIFLGAALASFNSLFYATLAGWSFQGFGAGVISVVSQTRVGECSERHNITSRFSYMSIVLSLAPLIAAVIGGLITEDSSWKYNFHIMMILTLTSSILILTTASPAPAVKTGISILKVLADYIRLLSKTIFLPVIMTSLVCFMFQGALMAYSSFLFIDQLGLTPAAYGFISVPVVIGSMVGPFIVMQEKKKYKAETTFVLNTSVAVTALTASLLYYLITGTHTVIELTLVMFIFSIGSGGHSVLAIRNVMTVFTSHRSQSSALVNFLNQFAGYLAVLTVRFLFMFIASVMAIYNLTCTVTTFLLIGSTTLYLKTVKTHQIQS